MSGHYSAPGAIDIAPQFIDGYMIGLVHMSTEDRSIINLLADTEKIIGIDHSVQSGALNVYSPERQENKSKRMFRSISKFCLIPVRDILCVQCP